MAIVVFCPNGACGVRLTLGDDHVGGELECPKCGELLAIPTRSAPPAPKPPPVPVPSPVPVKTAPTPPPLPLPDESDEEGAYDRQVRNGNRLLFAVASVAVLGVACAVIVMRTSQRDRSAKEEAASTARSPDAAPPSPASARSDPAAPLPKSDAKSDPVFVAPGVPPAPAPPVVPPMRAETIKLLAKELKEPEPEKRIKALKLIGEFGADANIVGEQLIEAMSDPVPAVSDAASESLEKVNPKAHPYVFTILRGMRKTEAAIALGALGNDAEIAVPLLLYCHRNPSFRGGFAPPGFEGAALPGPGPGGGSGYRLDFFPIIAKIAPKDRRFAIAVLEQIKTGSSSGKGQRGGGLRVQAIRQLKAIEAATADKVQALVVALEDGREVLAVITALEEFGPDAKPALPLLKKLKLSSNDFIRMKATEAVKKIEE